MKVIILGSGIIGVTTAYILSKAGFEVTVLEKESSSAMGCSYANGGQLSFSHAEPWSSRSSIISILKSAIKPRSSVYIKGILNKDFIKWSSKFILNSTKKRTSDISTKLLNLGNYSREVLNEILKEEKIDFHYNKNGILHFYRNKKLFDNAVKQAKFQESLGCNLKILNPFECVEVEPNLSALLDKNKLVGGILFKDDASGDPLLFILKLEEICKNKFKTRFIYDCEVKNILTNHKKVTGINTSKQVFQADLYVNTLGSYGNDLLNSLNFNTEIYPIKGYSLSIPADDLFLAPTTSLTDVENKIVYSRLGSTFRVAGTIEVCNLKKRKNPKNIDFLKKIVKSTYKSYGDMQNAKEWFGFRPYRPNCLPIIGRVNKYGNLFVNTGHGSLGWSNSFASAKIIGDVMLNKNLNSKFSFFDKEING